MTIHTKTALILLGTLVIGIVFGALVSGAVMRSWRSQYFIMAPPTPDRMSMRWEQIIQPENEAQRQAIRRVISRHTALFAETTNRHRAEIAALIDSLHKDLEPILTPEQLERLNDRRLRTPGPFPGRGPGRGPGDGPRRMPRGE